MRRERTSFFTGSWARALPRIAVMTLVTMVAAPAFACVNTFASRLMEAKGTGNAEELAKITAEIEQAWRAAPTLENTNDLAVGRILTGKPEEGIQLLRDLEKRQPGNAKVAANLGTALELTGSDQEALQWIRESVNRDPSEHQGSEWVHVKILEAKLALRRNSGWLRGHSVVGWREGETLLADERGLVRSPMDLIAPINYQLAERTQFVDAPDAIVGDLYLTLGDIAHSYPGAYKNGWERDAAESSNYHSALHFGTVHEVRARQRMEAADRRIEATRPERVAAAQRATRAAQLAEVKRIQEREDQQRREARREEQQRRRQLALWVFISLAVVVAAALFWRSRVTKP